ncbi:uncharacterized protein [Ptychodera flava]|uniref:uncharacterized protein n=1 Tax=Ptychodera flava TaxID=63121 RepID=UPI00396AA1BA
MALVGSLWLYISVIVFSQAVTVKACSRSDNKDSEEENEGPSIPSCCGDFLKRVADVNPKLSEDGSVSYTQCVFNRDSGCLACDSPTGSSHCCTMANSIKDDTHYSGPVPRGEYLMSQVTHHPMHAIDWIKLLPKKIGEEDYWSYSTPNEIGRSYMSLHPGCLARASVTVDTCAEDSQNDGDCWERTRVVIQGGSIIHNGVLYSGKLRVV